MFVLATTSVLPSLCAEEIAVPAFTSNAVVHDPSVVRAGATYYVFGSHMASASSTDLMNWTQISTSAAAPNPLIRNGTPRIEFAETLAYAQTDTFWAPDAIRLGDGKYYYYYCACRGDSPLSALGMAVAEAANGPYANVGILLKSGKADSNPAAGTYNVNIHPNVVDPSVFFDQTGKLWMVYGSFSGGIFILALDSTPGSPTIGRPLPNQAYGKKLIGGNSSRIEGGYIIYSPETDYYYLLMTFGGLDAAGGYNVRVGRSSHPDGPFFDAAGNDLTNVKGNFAFDDATIAPYGVKLMGNWQFLHASGDAGTQSRGYLSPGGVSVYRDPVEKKYLMVFHTRFVGRGEQHEVRVHQLFINDQGWLVAAPHRYAHETIATTDVGQILGDFKLINHGKAISAAVNTSTIITLQADHAIVGAATGAWQLSGDHFVTLTLDGTDYHGVFVRQWDDDNQAWTIAFSALSDGGVSVWGSKLTRPAPLAFVAQPESQTAGVGQAVVFSVATTGAPAPTYQWRKDGVAIAGATSVSLALSSVQLTDAGAYTVVASNAAGAVTSAAAMLTVNPPAPVAPSAPAQAGAYASGPTEVTLSWQPPANDHGNAVTGYQVERATDAAFATGRVAFDLGPATSYIDVTATAGGTYYYRISALNAGGASAPSATLTVQTPAPAGSGESPLVNISTRAYCGTGNNVTIGGFVIGGTEKKKVLVRAVGPTLGTMGLKAEEVLADPKIEVHDALHGNGVIATNDNWGDAPDPDEIMTVAGKVGATPLANDPEKVVDETSAALVLTLDPGVYTFVASGQGGTTGIVLLEVYDADLAGTASSLVNISTRALGKTGNDVTIGGFVIGGHGTKRVLVRAVGPTLRLQGIDVAEVMADPVIELHDALHGNGVVATNDNWKDNANAAEIVTTGARIGATPLANDPEKVVDTTSAALLLTMPPGIYTFVVTGKAATSGIVLLEVYDAD